MNKILKITFTYLLLIAMLKLISVCEGDLYAQKTQKVQQKMVVSPVPVQKIEKFRQDNSFKYVKQPPLVDVWSIVLRWLGDFIKMAFSNEGVAPYIRYVIIILVVAFVISKIGGGNFSGIFASNLKSNGINNFEYGKDNIHKINFEKEIKNAVKKQNFRLASRFLYLKLLKVLNEMNYIDWQVGKTNFTYQLELNSTNISSNFKKLSGMYEYSWYGHFNLNQLEFEQISKEYENTFIILNAH